MGFLSKLAKGLKGAVKKVAKGVKKVAKGLVTSLPGGQKLWKAGGKLGTKVMKGIAKVTAKLGPVGMVAVSALLSATGVGAALAGYMSSMWAGFGAASAAAAASTNVLMSALGTAGSGLFAAGNFAAGTLGALGNAITDGAAQLAQGNFSAAASSFGTNLGSALSGEAGMASVNAAAATAAQSAGTLLGDPSIMGNTFSPTDMGLESAASVDNFGKVGENLLGNNMTLDPNAVGNIGNVGSDLGNTLSNTGPQFATIDAPLTMAEQANVATFGQSTVPSTLAEQDSFLKYGNTKATPSLLDNANSAKSGYDKVKGAFSGGGVEPQESQGSLLSKPSASSAIKSSSVNNGQGSEGFSLLKGVQGLEQSLRNSQNLMFT